MRKILNKFTPKTTLNKINLALTVVFVLLLGANHYIQQANAAFGKPDCPPDSDETVTMFPNPEDCSTYFICDNGEAVPQHCPPCLIFCEELKACDWPNDQMCTYNCVDKEGVIQDAYLKCEAGGVETLTSSRSGEISLFGFTIKVGGLGKSHLVTWERWVCVIGPKNNTCVKSEQGVRITEVRKL